MGGGTAGRPGTDVTVWGGSPRRPEEACAWFEKEVRSRVVEERPTGSASDDIETGAGEPMLPGVRFGCHNIEARVAPDPVRRLGPSGRLATVFRVNGRVSDGEAVAV